MCSCSVVQESMSWNGNQIRDTTLVISTSPNFNVAAYDYILGNCMLLII